MMGFHGSINDLGGEIKMVIVNPLSVKHVEEEITYLKQCHFKDKSDLDSHSRSIGPKNRPYSKPTSKQPILVAVRSKA
jgi:hypothetical protein